MICKWVKASVAMCLYLAAVSAHGARIDVVGLFKDKAVVVIDGTRRVLTLFEVSPEGVKLLAVESDYVVLEIAGKRAIHRLGADQVRHHQQQLPGHGASVAGHVLRRQQAVGAHVPAGLREAR